MRFNNMLFCYMPLFGASLEVISTEKTFRSLTFFRENYSSLILIVVKDSLNFFRLLRVVITPSVVERRKRLEAMG